MKGNTHCRPLLDVQFIHPAAVVVVVDAVVDAVVEPNLVNCKTEGLLTRINSQFSSFGVKGWVLELSDFRVQDSGLKL